MEERQDSQKTNSKWYDPILKIAVGTGIIATSSAITYFALRIGANKIFSSSNKELEKELREANIIGKEIPDKFYLTDGKLTIYEIDGRPVTEYFNKAEK